MKFFLVFAVIVAVASAKALKPAQGLTESQMDELQQIWDAIHSPSTDPTTAAMLEQMLLDLLGVAPIQPIIVPEMPPPIHVPGIIEDGDHPGPIHIPGIIEDPIYPGPIHIPGIVEDYHPIDISPVLVPNPQASSSPLVQIIVNVNKQAEQAVPGEVAPTPVEIVEDAEVIPTPVIVVEEADQVQVVDAPEYELEPVHVAPIVAAPAVVEPETLN